MRSVDLSILIPSTFDRQEMTETLVRHIKLHGLDGERYEVLTDYDNREVSIGAKRQRMLEAAQGRYVVFIDSDDWVESDYLHWIFGAIEQDPDCIGFKIACTGTPHKTGIASNRFQDWRTRGNVYERTIYHKNPIRRDIALQIGFKDMRFGEDYDFSKRLKQSGLLTKEVFIPRFLYFYRFRFENPTTKYGFNK